MPPLLAPISYARKVWSQVLLTAVFAVLLTGLGAAYGDWLQCAVFSSVLLTLPVFAFLSLRLGSDSYPYLSGGLNYGTLLLAQIVLPPGPAAACLLLPYMAGCSRYTTSRAYGAVMFLFGSLTVYFLPSSGIPTGLCSVVPEFATFVSVLSLVLLIATAEVRNSRNRSKEKEDELMGLELQLHEERQALAQLKLELDEANAAESEANLRLAVQLERQTLVTAKLKARHSDGEELVRAIHHDLREPLRSIVSFNQLIRRRLESTPEAAAAAEYLDFAEDGGRRMVRMLDDLRGYTSGEDEQLVELEFGQVLENVLRDLHDLLQRTGARVTVGTLPRVRAYETQLTQLCQNLLANAIKFARPGVPPRVAVSCRELTNPRGGDYYHIDFSDNGIGIPSNQVEHIFGLFNRAHGQEEAYEGTGVGLALCRRIAIAHGATLTAASVPTEGTTFTLALPRSIVVGFPREFRGEHVPSAFAKTSNTHSA